MRSKSLNAVLLALFALNLYDTIPKLENLSNKLSKNETIKGSNNNYYNSNISVIIENNNEKENIRNVTNRTKHRMRNDNNKCALLFFGLPRCFEQAHASIKNNILAYNPQCDTYLHTFNIQSLPENKRNQERRTNVTINDVFKLTNNVTMDTMEDFHKMRNVSYYRQYFPSNQRWEYPTSMDNMIKQWHSIESVWNYMESSAINYDKIGLFRTDQVYKTPINISEYDDTDNKLDKNNSEYAVGANYGLSSEEHKFFNDRLFYGTYKYAKIWATHRFSFVEKYLNINESPVKTRQLHSETFLFYLIRQYIPIMQTKNDICACRIRNNCGVMPDCHPSNPPVEEIKPRNLPADERKPRRSRRQKRRNKGTT